MTRKEKRKARKLTKKKKRLYYKVLHQKKKPNKFIYGVEIFFAVIIETLRKLFKFVFVTLISGIGLATICGVLLLFKIYPTYQEYLQFAKEAVLNSSEEDFTLNESSTVYDSDGNILANLHEDSDLEYLSYDEIPDEAINAFIAVEDRSYWTNSGIDLKGIIRVAYNAVMTKGDEVHGASTITQQLARNIFLTHEVSIERKAKEILIAQELTDKYSKRQILEFYINNVCFANGVYGLSGASKAYFNCGVDELSLSQIAYLCAIPNRPSYYDPYKYPENAIERRDKILGDMYECGYISNKDYQIALNEDIIIDRPEYTFNDYETTFAVDCAVKYLMKLDGFNFQYKFATTEEYKSYHESYSEKYAEMKHELYTGGYEIYTSLDSNVYNNLQTILDENLAFNDEIDEETGIYSLQGAITCIDNDTGKVVAVVGGRSQDTNNIYSLNRAYQSYRQPGSSIKPLIVYAPALELGYTANTTVEDISVTEAKKKDVNVQELHGTQMTLRSAVENSKNGVAWKLFDRIQPSYGMEFIENMHYSNLCPDDYYNSSALGGFTYGTTTVEQASGYATLANHGIFREPTCIVSIKDRDGNEVFEEYEEISIYSSKSADDMVDILKGVITQGTASKLRWNSSSDIEAFAKTGTTNDSKDGWLCGSTPYYSIAVWVGYDTPRTLSNLYGATYPGQIWKECMLSVTEGLEEAKFERDLDDKSYDKESHLSGYYSYLEGRDDSEVLSEGYTVADYRNDRVIGESVYIIIDQINDLNMSEAGADAELERLYNQGLAIIDTIYSRKYTAEMTGYLSQAYSEKLN